MVAATTGSVVSGRPECIRGGRLAAALVSSCSGGGPKRKQIALSAVPPDSTIYSMLKIDRRASDPDLGGSVYKNLQQRQTMFRCAAGGATRKIANLEGSISTTA